ncbi:NERD domain-containing protein [Pseudomonas sp.]|uniref:nuclease-related domain-containing DEAD/DEAH box helicase n=1 Tax=Pseudomonas sp. TaxID=306 RepID=UPI003BB6BB40
MARMIPSSFPIKTPVGERDLFEKLRGDPDTTGWVVLHSLDLKKHQSKIEGELDMVVLVPGQGVLCIEVKGCDVSRLDGKWIYPYGASIEGPFKQASRAMHSLRDYLVDKDRSLSKLMFFSAVVFTRVNFDEQSPEWHPWQFINKLSFVRRPVSYNINNIFIRAHQHVASCSSSVSWYSGVHSRPSESQVRKMIALLRDNFEYSVSSRSDLESLEQRITQFTDEQFESLDLLRENERVLFKGPAGTGKTFLALETAKRAVFEGKRVLLVCYNSLLGEWLEAQTELFSDDPIKLKCGTFHSLLLEIAKVPPKNTAEYWRKELPVIAADRLLDDKYPWPIFDMLVIDESQDLLEEEYLDVLDLLLKGGLAGGKWAFFGDFERQAIFMAEGSRGAQKAIESLCDRAPHHAKYSLRINCRNARQIADTLAITSGLAPGYRKVLHDIEGADVDPLFYSSAAEQESKLAYAILDLKKTFKAGEIVVLSMRNDESSCAGGASSSIAGIKLAPIRKVQDGYTIPFTSVHAFKGLEAPAVIITDIDILNDERARALLYVAMSRARVRLFLLMHESCRKNYDRLLDVGLQMTSST